MRHNLYLWFPFRIQLVPRLVRYWINVSHRPRIHLSLLRRDLHFHDVPFFVMFPLYYAVQHHVFRLVDHGQQPLDVFGRMTRDVAVLDEFCAYREGGLGQGTLVAGEQAAAGAEEAAVAGEGAEGGGGRHEHEATMGSRLDP